jgi:2-polyprenyl-3-methyl-5-hydroxy-6-metoxy-1,4-benzoquinol methylase
MQLKFVQSEVGDLTGKSILDIGCATGELAFQLANAGANVTGIDLNEDLLDQARKGIGDLQPPEEKTRLKIASPIPIFRVSNMLELTRDFKKEKFDAVICFGNTLVHLPTMELINQTLQGVNYVLKPGGKFFLQMLNYDYILNEKVTELPVIETENIRFIRKYKFRENSSLIQFKTDLHIKKENKTISNETTLLALKSSELVEMLGTAGFFEIELFSNFKRDAFGRNHLPLVLSCRSLE